MPFHVHEVGAASRTAVDPLTGHRQPPCRFAVSPLWELREAVRALEAPGCGEEWRLPWLRRIRTAASGLDLRPLWPLLRDRATTPEFLCPPPSGAATAIEDELARVRAADPARAAAELTRSAAGTGVRGRAPAADPARAVRELADLLELAWRALLAPHWPWLRGLLEADAAFHTRRLADEGPSALFRELHPRLGWEEGALTVRTGAELTRLAADNGLVLLPSVFVRADVVVGASPGWRRTVAYPARGTAGLWAEPGGGPPCASGGGPPEALVTLLGRGRASVLAALAEPATTTGLARRLGLAPSSVSAHLSALRAAGLLTSDRHGHQVLYERTPLGIALAQAT